MSFQQTHLISLLNQPFEDQFAAQEDPFDDFLNIPDSYTFEDVVAKDVLNPAVETSDRQVGFGGVDAERRVPGTVCASGTIYSWSSLSNFLGAVLHRGTFRACLSLPFSSERCADSRIGTCRKTTMNSRSWLPLPVSMRFPNPPRRARTALRRPRQRRWRSSTRRAKEPRSRSVPTLCPSFNRHLLRRFLISRGSPRMFLLCTRNCWLA